MRRQLITFLVSIAVLTTLVLVGGDLAIRLAEKVKRERSEAQDTEAEPVN